MSPIEYRKQLTDRIIEQLESGVAPWIKPWDENVQMLGRVHNAITGRPYTGGNSLWLQCHCYADPRWCTYKQAQAAGWHVKKGQKAAVVEYWKWEETAKDEAGLVIRDRLTIPKVFYAHIFNAQQIEGMPEVVPIKPNWVPEVQAEQILIGSGASIYHDQEARAFYSPTSDDIHLPPRSIFSDATKYYATALHELGHWTGHESRLGREISNRFGTEDYAREELRAELASFFLASRLGIPNDPTNHAAYIGSWIKVLQHDHNEIFRAAGDAEKITEFVLQFQHEKSNQIQSESESTFEPEAEL